jgi:hypothetical protein
MGRGGRGDRELDPRRRLWIQGVIGLVFVAGVAIWAAVPRDGATGEPALHRGGPRLAIDQELIDFGAVRYNQFVEARFRLKNVGDQPLRLPASPPIEVVEGC